ncbi:hypothetical protein AgCh_006029 [Apium graveolens]
MGSLWRERDTSEAERAQHVKQIHDFQDHMQEKERQFMELQEHSGNNVGNQLNVSGDCQTHDSGTLPNGNFENDLSSKSQGNASGHVGRVKPLNYHMVKEDMRLQRKESRNRAVTILTLSIISFSQTPDN